MLKVLGPFRSTSHIDLTGALEGRTGALLQTLLLLPNQLVPLERIGETVWPGDEAAPDRLRQRAQVLVSRLRSLLTDELGLGEISIVSDGNGYRLVADATTLDRVAFEDLATAALDGDLEAGQRALELWQGEPYTGFTWSSLVQGQRRDLIMLRSRVDEQLRASINPQQLVETHLGSRFSPPLIDWQVTVRRERLLTTMPRVGEARSLQVVAPAGYGKSHLLAQWASDQAAPVVWVNADVSYDDPARFWGGVARAAQLQGMEIDDGGRPPGTVGFLNNLTAGLSAYAGKVGLVIDDLHHIIDPRLLDQIGTWIRSLPDTVTVAFGSRRTLPFGDSRLRMSGEAQAISADDLRFTEEEIRLLAGLTRPNGDETIDPDRLRTLTDGWPLAVSYLATVARSDDGGAISSTLGDYVVEEVLRGAPETVTSFILHTVHLDFLHPTLCDEITGRTDSRQVLDWLAERQLIVTGHARGRSWWRYHHLFAQLLRQRAEADPGIDPSSLHRRAARWFHAHGVVEEALKHALAADDDELIADTSGDVLLRTALNGEVENCRRWWHALRPDSLRTNRRSHDLAMVTAIHWGDDVSRQPWLESRLRWFGGDEDTMLTYVNAVLDTHQGRAGQALAKVRRVIEEAAAYCEPHAPDLVPALIGQAYSTLVVARVLEGAVRHDDPEFEALVGMVRPGGSVATTWIYGCWALLAYVDGAHEAAASFVEMFELGRAEIQGLGVQPASLGAVAAALLASDRTSDPSAQAELAAPLEAGVVESQRHGLHTEVALARLALHRLYRRAGRAEDALRQARLADALIRSFEDAPLVERARRLLVEEHDIVAGEPEAVTEAEADPGLTSRELTVLNYLDSDLTFEEIARGLYVSPHTVKAHARSIYRKLGVRSRLQAVRRLRRSASSTEPSPASAGSRL